MCTCNLSRSCVTHKIIAGTVYLLHNLLCTPPSSGMWDIYAPAPLWLRVPVKWEEENHSKKQFKNCVGSALQGTVDMCNLSICTSIIYVPHIILFIPVEMAGIPYCVMLRYAQQTQIYCQYRLCNGWICRWFDKNLLKHIRTSFYCTSTEIAQSLAILSSWK